MNETDKILLTPAFWWAAGIRTLRTFAQSLAGSLTIGIGLNKWDWSTSILVSLTIGFYTLLTAVAFPNAIPEVKPRHSVEE